MRIKHYGFALTGCAIALFSLLAGSGIGKAYGLYPKAAVIIGALYLLLPVGKAISKNQVRRSELVLFLALLFTVCVWPMYQGKGFHGFEYAWLLTLPYVLGRFSMNRQDLKWMALAVGGTGIAVVAARGYTSLFGGWNANDIAIMGFFSAAVFFSAPWESRGEKLLERGFLLAMLALMWRLDSRSCLMGMLMLLALSLGFLRPEKLLKSKWLRRTALLFPLIACLTVVLFQNAAIFSRLNEWSMEVFQKQVFSNRNTIWEEGLALLQKNFFFGSGAINNGYWHNVAISALTAFGVVGYGAWLYYFENIFLRVQPWRRDPGVFRGCAAFLVIMVQQSFELGLISTTGSMLPYLILGMVRGRMLYLEHKK